MNKTAFRNAVRRCEQTTSALKRENDSSFIDVTSKSFSSISQPSDITEEMKEIDMSDQENIEFALIFIMI